MRRKTLMGVTFSANTPSVHTTTKDEPCLCAQMAECFCDAFDNGVTEAHRIELAVEAQEGCHSCKGTGVESVTTDDAPFLDLNIGNASALLRVMGLSGELWGSLSIAEARRGVLRARNRSSLSAFERAEEVVHGRPRTNEDGSVELRPLRVHGAGLDAAGLLDRIERFASFVEAAAARGATEVTWS